MNWKLHDEILTDLMQIISSVPETEGIVALIQWQGKHLAGIVYQPSPFQLVGMGATATRGMSIVPSPASVPSHWVPFNLKYVPTRNGVPLTEDMPIFYFTHLKHDMGDGLVLPARYDKYGRINWSGNEDAILEIGETLVTAGVIHKKVRPGVDNSNKFQVPPSGRPQ